MCVLFEKRIREVNMIAEVTDFELWQRAVRKQFQEGESIETVLLGAGLLIGVVVITLTIARWQSRWRRRGDTATRESRPHKLYTHLLCTLGFTAAHRHLLEAVAKAAELENPTSLLISDVLFDRSVAAWEATRGKAPADERRVEERRAITAIRSRLFPDGRGLVRTPAA